MRIAVFTKSTTFHSGYGGLETQNKVLCEGLAARGHTVVVFSPKQEVVEDMLTDNGVLYVFIPAVYRMGIFFQGFEEKLSKVLAKVVPSIRTDGVFSAKGKEDWLKKSYDTFQYYHAENKFDVVLNQSAVGLGIINNKKVLSVPVISISHGTILGEYKTRLQEIGTVKSFLNLRKILSLVRDTAYVVRNFFGRQRQFIHGSDKVIAVSHAVKKQIINETYVLEDKIVVINNGIDPKLFEKAETEYLREKNDSREVSLLYIGRVERPKGLFELVEVLSAIYSSFKNVGLETKLNIKLDVYGDGPDLPELKTTATSLSQNNIVTFHGKVPHDVVISKYFSADIFVLPTLRMEGFPMTLVEAMFAGLPIIASDIGGISDAVVDGQNGFLVPPGDKNSLKEKILELTKNPGLRNQMAETSKKMAYEKFTVDDMLDKYEQVINAVLEK